MLAAIDLLLVESRSTCHLSVSEIRGASLTLAYDTLVCSLTRNSHVFALWLYYIIMTTGADAERRMPNSY